MDHDKTDAGDSGADAVIEEGGPEPPKAGAEAPVEVNGPKGPEPTRYGDWEQKGRCSDF